MGTLALGNGLCLPPITPTAFTSLVPTASPAASEIARLRTLRQAEVTPKIIYLYYQKTNIVGSKLPKNKLI